MRKLGSIVGGLILVSIFVCGFIAYFVTSFDADTRQWFDGFGRPLSQSPWFMRVIFGQERLWAGWLWFMADMTIFWGGIAVGFSLVSFGTDKRK